jgi:cephalosporin-C deacetylase-like acetyl esterase
VNPFHFPLPLPSSTDPRSQLTARVLGRCLSGLEASTRRRAEALENGRLREYRDAVRASVRRALGPMPFGAAGGPLNTRLVSSHETRHCRLENVLFESFPGWQVNASIFVPRGRGPFRAVVIPVGHSGKQFDNYQVPAQAFASLGFLTVLFDPPGQSSERQRGNDHFIDGVRCYLTELSSQRYFVLDALRCIDYLETRPDADLSGGVGMSGVSGGGATTVCAALFDGKDGGAGRIACQGPSCCFAPMADHPIGNAYAACPETLWPGRIPDGVDEQAMALAGFPVPLLLMAGARDEVFRIEWARSLAEELTAAFRGAGAGERFSFLEDEGGHAYSLRQVTEFAAWMDRWLPAADGVRGARPPLDPADFPMLDAGMLRCRPSEETNIFTLNRDAARSLARARPASPDAASLRRAVGRLVGGGGGARAEGEASWEQSDPAPLWCQEYREARSTWDGMDMPVSLFTPVPPYRASRRVLYLDDGGRCCALEADGPAARIARFLERDPDSSRPALAVADLPGWGESEPALLPYAAVSWGSRDRLLAYASAALGDPVLAIRVRAAVALLEAFYSRMEKDGIGAGGVALVGRGLAGTVALMAAALSAHVDAVAAWSYPASFHELAESEEYAWPATAFLPGALREIDLPELARGLAASGRKVLLLEPLDARMELLDAGSSAALHAPFPAGLTVVNQCAPGDPVRLIEEMLYSCS